jgi:hypothetical protein
MGFLLLRCYNARLSGLRPAPAACESSCPSFYSARRTSMPL